MPVPREKDYKAILMDFSSGNFANANFVTDNPTLSVIFSRLVAVRFYRIKAPKVHLTRARK